MQHINWEKGSRRWERTKGAKKLGMEKGSLKVLKNSVIA